MDFSAVFSTKGRRGRLEFFATCIFISIMGTVTEQFPILNKLIFPKIIIMYFAFTNIVKRLHDTNHSGYWAIAWYVCFFLAVGIGLMLEMEEPPDIYIPNGIALILLGIVMLGYIPGTLFLLFKKGTVGPNQYGEDPLKE